MKFCATVFFAIATLMIDVDSPLAIFSLQAWQEIYIGAGILVTLAGVYLCWHAPRYQMSIEERAKDGKLTEDQARRIIRRQSWFGPMAIMSGITLIGFVVLG